MYFNILRVDGSIAGAHELLVVDDEGVVASTFRKAVIAAHCIRDDVRPGRHYMFYLRQQDGVAAVLHLHVKSQFRRAIVDAQQCDCAGLHATP